MMMMMIIISWVRAPHSGDLYDANLFSWEKRIQNMINSSMIPLLRTVSKQKSAFAASKDVSNRSYSKYFDHLPQQSSATRSQLLFLLGLFDYTAVFGKRHLDGHAASH